MSDDTKDRADTPLEGGELLEADGTPATDPSPDEAPLEPSPPTDPPAAEPPAAEPPVEFELPAEVLGRGEGFFTSELEAALEEKIPDFGQTLNIAVIGKVSSGKSSVINAFLERERDSMVAHVGAVSGVTTKLKVIRLDDRVRIVDSPGLDDIRADNSRITQDFLRNVDVGIFVVTGSADESQRSYLNDLRRTCDATFVVLNKVDEWDRYSPSARQKVIEQWEQSLHVDRVYPTCTWGYDPDVDADLPLDIRGVDELRNDVEAFLAERGKDLLLARHMNDKFARAWKIIAGSLTAVGTEAFLPGSAVYITATQAAAVGALYYMYTGRILSKQSTLALLPSFAARTAGQSLFLWAKSLFPPTGILDAAAAALAVVITFAMLAAVNSVLASGHELHERELLTEKFEGIHAAAKERLTTADISDWKDPEYWKKAFHDLMYK